MPRPTVLILGAAGRLGQCLCEAFVAAGWQVLAQARKPLPQALAARVQPLRCDALDRAALLQGGQGASVVINALNPPYAQWQDLALPLADAAQATAQALGALLMLPGNVYNFGRELPAVLRPDTPEAANTSKAAIRIAIETRMAAAAAQGLDSLVLRAGDFFGGAGRGSWFDLVLLGRLRRRRVVHPGALDQLHAWAYLPDLAAAFVRLAAQREQLRGHQRLHFAGHALTGAELHAALEAACGQALKKAAMPWWLVALAAPLLPSWRALLEMRYLWQRPHRLDDAALRARIGAVPHTPLDQALACSLASLGMAPAAPEPMPLRR